MNTLFKIRVIIVFYMVALVVAGASAFPVEWELDVLCSICNINPESLAGMGDGTVQSVFHGFMA